MEFPHVSDLLKDVTKFLVEEEDLLLQHLVLADLGHLGYAGQEEVDVVRGA